jgi:hypothetical protein
VDFYTFCAHPLDRVPLLSVTVCLAVGLGLPNHLSAHQAAAPARVLGTVQSIADKSLTVISDSGSSSAVVVEDATKFFEIAPGKTDLKEATPLTFSDLQVGDRVLVRGIPSDDGKTLRAASVIAVKKTAIAQKQAQERADWQRGVGGLVKSVDSSAGTIVVTTNGFSANKEVTVRLGQNTILRRYAADSTRFDAAKPAPLSEVRPGDQLRARGTRSESGAEVNAAEIVSGTFRSIAGTILSTDTSASTVVVQDLATKAAVSLKITSESQMRKLPAQFAESLAGHLKNQSDSAGQPAAANAATTGSRGGGDFQQMIARMPAASLADLQKGDAVMVVTTQGNGGDPLTIITLLDGVEAVLRASSKGGQDMILSPWSLGGGEPTGN